MQAEEGTVMLHKYKIMEKIGSGSFGSIYSCMLKVELGQDMISKQRYAAKIEKKGKGDGQLQYQIKLYQLFQGVTGIAKLLDYGHQNERLFMIIELLSHSLQDLFQLCGKKFSLSTTFYIANQLISRLQAIHRKGFVHRDIKANNFMIGKKDKIKTVYVIDFGLAKRYKDIKTGIHIAPKGGKSLVGTARYASIASHDGYQQCRRDDLESLGYMLLYFIRGKLPWQGIQIQSKTQKYAQIGKMKKQACIEKICYEISPSALALARYFETVKALGFQEQPNYDLLRKNFKQQLIKMKQDNKPLDWESILIDSQGKQQK